jgi:hypothetical protein
MYRTVAWLREGYAAPDRSPKTHLGLRSATSMAGFANGFPVGLGERGEERFGNAWVELPCLSAVPRMVSTAGTALTHARYGAVVPQVLFESGLLNWRSRRSARVAGV